MRPNILVFLTDDHAQWAVNCYGSDIGTPSMDYLARTGARMANAYTPCPVCSPARVSFWTGRLPSQHGIHDWIHEPTHTEPWLTGETTLAQLLQAAGYQTGMVGKWHCGQSWVPQSGFDYYLGENKEQYPHRGICRFTENGQPVEYQGQRSAFVTERGLDFLRRRDKTRPFFLFVGYVDTHSPFREHPERLVEPLRSSHFTSIPNEKYVGPGRAKFSVPIGPEQRQEHLAQYHASVEYIDEQVGAFLDYLEANGELDNTLVVYTSDHGHMNGHHGLYTKGNATIPQNFYDESIRVPCLLRWPGRIRAGQVNTAPVNHCDLFQTLLDASGTKETSDSAAKRNSPGQSYLPCSPRKTASGATTGSANMVTPEWSVLRATNSLSAIPRTPATNSTTFRPTRARQQTASRMLP
jgi:arylsulfatase A-like enzyme